MWLLDSAGYLNLSSSLVVLLIAAFILWQRPRPFLEHPFLETAFAFWSLEWGVFVLIWLYYRHLTAGDPRLLLALVDLQTICALGFFVAFWEASKFRWQSSVPGLCLLYLLLVVWNVILADVALPKPAGHWLRSVWTFPSGALSVAVFGLVALAFVWRHRRSGIVFAAITFAYVLLQRPTYAGAFTTTLDERPWLVMLAFGKLAYGAAFYARYLVPTKEYSPIRFPKKSYLRSTSLTSAAKWLVLLILGALAKELLALLIKYSGLDAVISRIFHSH